jgi:hypothetical protein
MDLVLSPLKLELHGQGELVVPFLDLIIPIFDMAIWKFSVPPIRRTVLEIPMGHTDPSPPEYMALDVKPRAGFSKRSVREGCAVRQVAGRYHIYCHHKWLVVLSVEVAMLPFCSVWNLQ